MDTVDLGGGTIHYETAGPSTGRPVVFIHGYAMGGSLWRPLSARLARDGLRCIAPTWPLGAHQQAMRPPADMSMRGVAAMVAEFLDVAGLDDVVLVGNDTGGAVAQVVVTEFPERVGALVLTSCDAFEHFPPPILAPLITAAKVPLLFRAAVQVMRSATVRRRAYGGLAHCNLDALTAEWTHRAIRDRAITEDLRRFTGSLHRRTTLEAAARLPVFTRPALIAWSADDVFFPQADGRRLAEALPCSRLEFIEGARTFSMLDAPDVLAELIAEFATAADPVGRPSGVDRC
ncbi:alpha/beta hydrolase [Mycobacterium sp. CVI_P3]|uniref:Alpha/beta hydrolase n=1 Tax=Mycobacterium pinniadriaticum TaxID=2994102 RepID=A0ABT3S6G6_9MYCO|nr:alpha/beta hydrolase [Mycobacterium pinniadriaticum]MCX2929040.1 alpha/beta hydrolase [Mycobacterium pinniadriaticum]MCX2935093.1 alpha/beta hydrolase [Mycobacterium pinniadriaticum]